MRIVYQSLLIVFLSLFFVASNYKSNISKRHHRVICYYNPNIALTGQPVECSWDDDTGLIPTIEKIKRVTQFNSKFLVGQTTQRIDNAYATIYENQRTIICDVDFLESLNEQVGTQWAAISVVAHEIGHHYYGHIEKGSNPLPSELEADYFCGFALARLGASKEAAIAAMDKGIGTEEDTPSHPNKYDRIKYIINGWEKGKSGR
jgi:hypothetical protein